ncbi:hypothetical protein FB451DRAFT_1451762 [Mycena latifolia]|nr:hypothetical protein FB451DRAFT_1451762 [Mycena latifolia]
MAVRRLREPSPGCLMVTCARRTQTRSSTDGKETLVGRSAPHPGTRGGGRRGWRRRFCTVGALAMPPGGSRGARVEWRLREPEAVRHCAHQLAYIHQETQHAPHDEVSLNDGSAAESVGGSITLVLLAAALNEEADNAPHDETPVGEGSDAQLVGVPIALLLVRHLHLRWRGLSEKWRRRRARRRGKGEAREGAASSVPAGVRSGEVRRRKQAQQHAMTHGGRSQTRANGRLLPTAMSTRLLGSLIEEKRTKNLCMYLTAAECGSRLECLRHVLVLPLAPVCSAARKLAISVQSPARPRRLHSLSGFGFPICICRSVSVSVSPCPTHARGVSQTISGHGYLLADPEFSIPLRIRYEHWASAVAVVPGGHFYPHFPVFPSGRRLEAEFWTLARLLLPLRFLCVESLVIILGARFPSSCTGALTYDLRSNFRKAKFHLHRARAYLAWRAQLERSVSAHLLSSTTRTTQIESATQSRDGYDTKTRTVELQIPLTPAFAPDINLSVDLSSPIGALFGSQRVFGLWWV